MKMRKNMEAQDVPLDLREKLIICQRYMLHNTFTEIGAFWGVSRQRIHQVTSEFEEEARRWVKGVTVFDLNAYNGPGLP